jgi:membrane fusion protein, multidrug efflux system
MTNKIAFALLVLFLAACGSGQEGAEQIKSKIESLQSDKAALETEIAALEEQLKGMDSTSGPMFKTVNIEEVAIKTFTHFVEIQGQLQTDNNVAISAKVPGVIQRIRADEGKFVQKGTVLAEIDATVLERTLAEVQSSYELVKSVYDRQENLWKQKIGTELQFLQAKNNKESLELKIATLREQLAQYRIVAPISGTVDMVNVKLGETVAPGIPVFRIVNTSSLKAKADISETYISQVKQGARVVILIPDAGKEMNSKIAYASKVIDPMSRTFTIEANVSNASNLKPNMVCKIKIVDYTNNKSKIVPVNVIQTSDQGSFVWVVVGDQQGVE